MCKTNSPAPQERNAGMKQRLSLIIKRRKFLNVLVLTASTSIGGCNNPKLVGDGHETRTITPKNLTPFDATEPKSFSKSDRQSLEINIHELVNEERKIKNYDELGYDEELSYIARTKSRDMAIKGYFGHKDPDGDTHTDRLDEYGYDWQHSAENLITRSTRPDTPISDIAKRAVNGFMSSPPHRGQILDSNYSVEGIGVYVSKNHKNFITQLLVN